MTQRTDRSSHRSGSRPLTGRLLLAALAFAAGVALPVTAALAQNTGERLISRQPRDPNARLLLAADELIYDNDRGLVTARGNVQFEYDGTTVVAETVVYDRNTRRVIASGNVEILEPGGNRITADRIDLTDDFSEGFVDALRVETPDDTRFAAESAERVPGNRTVFNNGTYTACRICKDNPRKPLTWQIKAERVVLNGEKRTVEYRNASFELFGRPIAFLPYFRHADPGTKRRSGFLAPTFGYRQNLGAFMRQPYFLATGKSHDLTVAVTGYTRQGFLADAEFRRAFESGTVTLRAAGIFQQDRSQFSTRPDTVETGRGMIATTGKFDINPRWAFGWDVLAQSDRTFSRTYRIPGYKSVEIDNNVYLRGLNDRSYFDLTAYDFLIQGPPLAQVPNFEYAQAEQPTVHPVLDYNRVKGDVLGGEATLDVNLTSLTRDRLSAVPVPNGSTSTFGIDGTANRLTAEGAFRRTLNFNGLLVTPSASIRGDAFYTDGFASPGTNATLNEGTSGRILPTLGFEVRYPLLVESETATQVIEPIAQLFVRPDVNDPTLPNEDSQSLVFDSSSLFERDKFSGYDRIESGTRANLGIRYSANVADMIAIDAVFGQSFHLVGDNPYARTDDLIGVGEASGLETDRSDYVAGFGLGLGSAFKLDVQARFDNSNLDMRRLETTATYAGVNFGASAGYTFIDDQPRYGFQDDREEMFGSINFKFARNWRAFAAATYDLDNGRFVSDSIGINYFDECFSFTLSYAEIHDRFDASLEPDRSLSFRVSLRTVGDLDTTLDTNNFDLFE